MQNKHIKGLDYTESMLALSLFLLIGTGSGKCSCSMRLEKSCFFGIIYGELSAK